MEMNVQNELKDKEAREIEIDGVDRPKEFKGEAVMQVGESHEGEGDDENEGDRMDDRMDDRVDDKHDKHDKHNKQFKPEDGPRQLLNAPEAMEVEMTDNDDPKKGKELIPPSSADEESLSQESGAGGNKIKKKRPSKGRVFQCTGYPDCNMSFTRSEHLARHKRKHTGERPFTCPHCSKNFSRLDNLRQHKQTVHGYGSNGGTSRNKGNRYSAEMGQLQPVESPGGQNHQNHNQNNNNNNNSRGLGFQSIYTNGRPYKAGLMANSHPGEVPVTPLNAIYTSHSPHSAPLISPPNSNSPVNYPMIYQYNTYNDNVYNNINGATNMTINQPSGGYPKPQTGLKMPPGNDIKPKRRPKPLDLSRSLADSTNNSNNSNQSNNALYMRLVLKSAPPIQYGFGHVVKSYVPQSAALTPSGTSPLSPLFHQAFNQTKDVQLRSPYPSAGNPHVAPLNSPRPNNTLPSLQHLPIPTQFRPIQDSSSTGEQKTGDPVPAPATKDQNTKTQASEPYQSRKPTIDILLSPNNDDKFPNSV